MAIWEHIFGAKRSRTVMEPLYAAIIGHGREPDWYRTGAVPDTKDGRFDMIAAIFSLVLARLEKADRADESALLTELFVADMDSQLREIGVGDVVVGKQVGKMMGALGGRLSAYRDAFDGEGDIEAALLRNLYRGQDPGEIPLEYSATRLREFHSSLAQIDDAAIVAGQLPPL